MNKEEIKLAILNRFAEAGSTDVFEYAEDAMPSVEEIKEEVVNLELFTQKQLDTVVDTWEDNFGDLDETFQLIEAFEDYLADVEEAEAEDIIADMLAEVISHSLPLTKRFELNWESCIY